MDKGEPREPTKPSGLPAHWYRLCVCVCVPTPSATDLKVMRVWLQQHSHTHTLTTWWVEAEQNLRKAQYDLRTSVRLSAGPECKWTLYQKGHYYYYYYYHYHYYYYNNHQHHYHYQSLACTFQSALAVNKWLYALCYQ